MKTLQKLTSLEDQLSTAIAARPGAIEVLQKRLAEAEATLESFDAEPFTADIDRASKAHTATTTAQALLSRLGDTRAWTEERQSAWVRSHHLELVALLESLVSERSAGREAYLESTAVTLGTVTTELARADTGSAPDSELVRLNDRLALIGDDRQNRENRLESARDALRTFSRAREDAAAYLPLYAHFLNARDAAAAVDFEIISEVVSLEKTPA